MKSHADGAGSSRSRSPCRSAGAELAVAPADRTVRRVALVGDAFVDVNLSGLTRLPSWGTDVDCAGVRMLPGGSCANTARQLGSLGGTSVVASFFGAVGDDELGHFFANTLHNEGLLVNTRESLQHIPGVPQSVCTILAGPADRAMISCYTSNERLIIEPCTPMLLASPPPALLHIGGYFNCVGLHDDAMIALVAQLKREHGTLITMDPQHDANEKWTGEDGHLQRLFPLLDVFLPNEIEISHVALHCGGIAANADGAMATLPSPEEALEALAAKFPHLLIVLTLGSQGLKAARGPNERWAVPARSVSFVDATGAGDACDAGFLVQFLIDPTDVEAALRAGAAAGALSVGVAGACEKPISREAWQAIQRET